MHNLQKKTEYSTFCIFVCLICAITNLSQMPIFVEMGITRLVALPTWVLLAGVCLLKDTRVSLKAVLPQFLLGVAFLCYYCIVLLLNERAKYSALPYPIALSLFVLFVGLMAGRYLDADGIKRTAWFYAISGVVVCVDVYFKYVVDNSLSQLVYSYASKNSVSQILLTAMWILLIFGVEKKGAVRKLLTIAAIAFLAWTLIGLKSRASLIMIPTVLLWLFFGKATSKPVRRTVVIVALMAAVVLMVGDNFKVLVEDVLLGGRDSTDLNSVSSGRTDEWREFPALFAQAPIFGHGSKARESLIITALLEYGLLGGSVILILAVSPLHWGFFKLRKDHTMYLLFTSLALCYVVNGIFEQLAPFGPGVKCYYLWFLMGMLAAKPEETTIQKRGPNK